jgi:uncharacterized protein (UPF0264 family)
LVSVRNASEARDALQGGADWIDLKEPRRGALGAVGAATAREIVESIEGRAPISAAAGELANWSGTARDLVDVNGITHIKLGLAGCADSTWQKSWLTAHETITCAGKSLVAVIYADADAARSPGADEILALAAHVRCEWVLWDTFDKQGRTLTEVVLREELTWQLRAARSAGLQTVLAGRLTLNQLSGLPMSLTEMIAVRGAACRAGRASSICAERVARLRNAIARHGNCSDRAAVADATR